MRLDYIERGDIMDIAALSTAMSQANLATQVSVAVTGKVMDMAEVSGDQMVKALEQSVQPHLGSNIDVRL